MNEKKQEILDKLAKIMILAGDQKGTPEGEAALNLASKLMAKHRIAESEIDLETDSLMEDEVQGYKDKGGWRQWILDLSARLADTFDCRTYFRTRSFVINFVGTSSDVETCVYFMEIVMHHIEEQAWEMWTEERNWRKRNEFGQAAMTVISSRLSDMKKRMTVEEEVMGSSCTDIVIRKKDMVNTTFEEAHPDLSSVRRRNTEIKDRKTWIAGKKAGESAPLSHGIEDKESGGNIE